jgi:cytochrome c-type biogenesis protein CcmH/NrfG
LTELIDRLNSVLADRYTVERQIGRGGMASVWLARDLRHERPVAIKVMHEDLAGAIGADRFLREIRLTARLQHPNIIPILDSGTVPGSGGIALPWYSMPCIDGESVRTRLERDRFLPVDEALRITEETAGALQAAHRVGIVHRDIKPENLLLADGRVYVADFGVAKVVMETGAERLTSTGLAIGTPVYMSPEQGVAGEVDARSDQYSLGCVLYEMLAGEPPFTGPTAQAVVARRLVEPPRRIKPVRPAVPEPVEAATLRALERNPADRFPDISAFAAALRGAPSTATSFNRARVGTRWRLAVAAVLLIAIAGGAWYGFRRPGGVQQSPVDPSVIALTQRGVRSYDRRSAEGAIDAIAAFSAAVKRDSTYSPAWNGLAKTYVRTYERSFPIAGVSHDNMLRLAATAVDRALASDSTSADVWLTQAILSRDVDPTDNGPVVRALNHALTLDSADARVWHFLALTRAENADFPAAMSFWRRSVKLDPRYTQGIVFLGIGHFWLRQFDSARVWADSGIAVDPSYVFGHSMAGFIAIERGDYDRAIASFSAARRLTNDVESLNAELGIALAQARAKRESNARATIRDVESQAAAYSPPPVHLVLYMAQAYAASGDFGRALGWLGRFEPRASLHFQLHLRCDSPFDVMRSDRRFQALLIKPTSIVKDCR